MDGIEKLNLNSCFYLKARSETVFEVAKNKAMKIKANKILDLFPATPDAMPCFTIYLKTTCC